MNHAQSIADELCSYLLEGSSGVKATVAGSLRRGKETIGDLDVLVTGGDREKLKTRMLEYPNVREVIARGENKISVGLTTGGGSNIQADIRFLDVDEYGSAMQYFTGSKEHNVALRQRALRMGYTLSEYEIGASRKRGTRRGKTGRGDLQQARTRFHPAGVARECR